MNKNLQSQTINWLRFPLIVLVVFIHNQGSVEKRWGNFLS